MKVINQGTLPLTYRIAPSGGNTNLVTGIVDPGDDANVTPEGTGPYWLSVSVGNPNFIDGDEDVVLILNKE